jgi:hypothetical protein
VRKLLTAWTRISLKSHKCLIKNGLNFLGLSARARRAFRGLAWWWRAGRSFRAREASVLGGFIPKILTIFKAFQLGKLLGLLKWKNFANGVAGVPIILLRILTASSLDPPDLVKCFLSWAVELCVVNRVCNLFR